MSITRQITVVNMIPAFFNGAGYFAFEGSVTSDYLFKAWNLTAEWTPEYYGGQVDQALSGRLRSNFRGYRLKLTLQLDNSTEADKIRNLFNKFSGGYNRTFYSLVTNGSAGTASGTVTFTSAAPAVSGYFTGVLLSGLTGGTTTVTNYTASRVASLAGLRTWTDALSVTASIQPNIATLILFDIEGTSSTYTDSDLIPCVVLANNYGVSRQSTIQQQRVGIELQSVELYKEIPDSYRIA
jgi:hypothetical protein